MEILYQQWRKSSISIFILFYFVFIHQLNSENIPFGKVTLPLGKVRVRLGEDNRLTLARTETLGDVKRLLQFFCCATKTNIAS